MNDREALKHIKATIGAFGPDEGIELDQKAWSKLHSAIKEALAQPDPEPVAWITVVETKQGPSCQVNWTKMRGISHEPLYTAPPQSKWIGLTENELSQIHNSANWNHNIDWSFERAIEAKLKEKNT